MELKLNDAQREAISHKDGPCMVLAGPGSGKTFTLTRRIVRLTGEYQIPQGEILVITFTKASAQEMKQRYLKMTGKKQSRVTFGTFHGIFYGILKWAYQLDSRNILSEEEKRKLLRKAVQQSYIEWDDSDAESEEELAAGICEEIGSLKNNQTAPEDFHSACVKDEIFREIYYAYEKERKTARKLDFDDMLVMCLDLFTRYPHILKQWQEKFRYIMIDEFQDINPVQYEIIRLLALPENNLFIVGDDDQSIYEFRGAKPAIMLGVEKDYPGLKKIFLNYNYRSTKTIVDGAVRVIEYNKDRFPKKFSTTAGRGEDIHVQEVKNPQEESRYVAEEISRRHQYGIAYGDMAVLFRTNSWAGPVLEYLVEHQVPVRMKEYIPNLYDHFTARDMAAYFRLGMGSRKRSDFLMVLNRPKRYLGRDSVGKEETSFEDLRKYYCDKDWMLKRIDQFEHDIRQLKNMTPQKAIQYIRKTIGYDEFLKEYALEHKIKAEPLLEKLAQIEAQAEPFQTQEQWFLHVEQYTKALEEERKKQAQEDTDAVNLLTMHGAKGLEFDTVFIIGANEEELPYKKAGTKEAVEEERRLFYVAMTRAKRKLEVTFVQEKSGKKQCPSRFLSELLFEP